MATIPFTSGFMRMAYAMPRFGRFVVVGALASLVHIGVLFFLTKQGIWYVAATTLGFLIAFVVSFTLQKVWTFPESASRTRFQVTYFFALQLANMAVNAAALYFLVDVARAPLLASQVLVLGLLAIGTYTVARLRIFTPA